MTKTQNTLLRLTANDGFEREYMLDFNNEEYTASEFLPLAVSEKMPEFNRARGCRKWTAEDSVQFVLRLPRKSQLEGAAVPGAGKNVELHVSAMTVKGKRHAPTAH